MHTHAHTHTHYGLCSAAVRGSYFIWKDLNSQGWGPKQWDWKQYSSTYSTYLLRDRFLILFSWQTLFGDYWRQRKQEVAVKL